MNFSALFIHRPIGTTLLTIALALAGHDRVPVLAGLALTTGGVPHH